MFILGVTDTEQHARAAVKTEQFCTDVQMLCSAFLQARARSRTRSRTLTFIRAFFIWRAEWQHCHCQVAFNEGGLESIRHTFRRPALL